MANHQPLLAIQTLNALLVDRMALAPQKHVQPPIAKPPAFLGQRFQPLGKFAVIRPPGPVNLDRFIVRPFLGGGLYAFLEEF